MSSPCCISILEKIFNFTVTQYLGSLGEEHKIPDVTTRGLLDTWSRNLEGEFANEPLIEVAVRQTLESRRRVLPDEHSDILESVDDLGLLYVKLGRYQEAETLLLEAVEGTRRVFGPDHPHTLESKNDLAVLYKEQARYDEAESLLLETLEGRRKVLGEEHPDTLVSLNNLIELYEAWGKPEKAEQWREELIIVD